MAARRTKSKPKKTKTVKSTKEVVESTPKVDKPSTNVSVPKAAPTDISKPMVAPAMIKKPELIDRIVAQSGLKKKDVKPVVEATLAVLTKTLLDGEELQIPPLGKVKILQTKDVGNAKVFKIKIRHAIKKTDAND